VVNVMSDMLVAIVLDRGCATAAALPAAPQEPAV
jgi:hypothetical protein